MNWIDLALPVLAVGVAGGLIGVGMDRAMQRKQR